MNKLLLLITGLAMGCAASAQNKVQPLYVGDRLPEITVLSIDYNSGKTTPLSLRHLAKKLTILDFWATYCGTCIEAFPKLEKLQRQFNEEVQLLLVNAENDQRIKKFLDVRKQVRHLSLSIPLVSRDSLLESLLPFNTLPHEVWLDEQGTVLAITESMEVDSANIAAILKDKSYPLTQKSDYHLGWNNKDPLFGAGNLGNGDQLQWRSLVSNYVGGLATSSFISANNQNGYTIMATNIPVSDLYQIAYSTDSTYGLSTNYRPPFLTNHLLKDSSTIATWIGGKFIPENMCSYQLSTPPTAIANLKKWMREDLERYFGFTADIVSTKKGVWILQASDPKKVNTKGGAPFLQINTLSGMTIRNQPAKTLIRAFYEYMPDYPIIDETHFTGNIDLVLKSAHNDPESVNKALAPYGLHLTYENRMVNILELGDPIP